MVDGEGEKEGRREGGGAEGEEAGILEGCVDEGLDSWKNLIMLLQRTRILLSLFLLLLPTTLFVFKVFVGTWDGGREDPWLEEDED